MKLNCIHLTVVTLVYPMSLLLLFHKTLKVSQAISVHCVLLHFGNNFLKVATTPKLEVANSRASNHTDLSVFLRIYTYKYGLRKLIQFIRKYS